MRLNKAQAQEIGRLGERWEIVDGLLNQDYDQLIAWERAA